MRLLKDTPLVESGLHEVMSVSTELEYAMIMSWAIAANNYKRILEIGTFLGHTTIVLADGAAKVGGAVVTVDPNSKYLIEHPHNVSLIHGTSDEFFYRNSALFDFIYIDGDHHESQAYRDIINAKKTLADGGMIAVHDNQYAEVMAAIRKAEGEIGGEWFHLTQGKGLSIGKF
jgi:predicted O-methyltransferase YrrM